MGASRADYLSDISSTPVSQDFRFACGTFAHPIKAERAAFDLKRSLQRLEENGPCVARRRRGNDYVHITAVQRSPQTGHLDMVSR